MDRLRTSGQLNTGKADTRMQDSTITMVQLKTTKQTLHTVHSTAARKPKPKSKMAKRRVCKRCGGPIVSIGSWRSNGSMHADWWGRAYHKQCWKALDHP